MAINTNYGYPGWSRPVSMSGLRTRAYLGYERGRKLCDNGNVLSIYLIGDVLHAVIRDGQAEHRVKFREHHLHEKSCRCSEESWFMCSHEVAALAYFFEHETEVVDAEMARLDAIDHFFRTIPKERLGSVESHTLRSDISAYEEFVGRLGLENVWVPRNYSRVLARLYDTAMRRSLKGLVDFGFYLGLVGRARDAGKHNEATAAYRTMSEIMMSDTHYMGNPYGYQEGYLIESLDRMTDSILRENCASKEQYISYFYQRCRDDRWSRYRGIYRECLEDICETADDLEYWERIVADDLAGCTGDAPAHLLLMRSYILQRLGDLRGAVESLSSHLLSDRDVALRYLSLLDDIPHTTDSVHAILEAFPHDQDVMESVLRLLPDSDPQKPAVLSGLFKKTENWDLFFELKGLSGDWNAELRRLSGLLSPSHLAVEVYVREKMFPEAMKLLESLDDPALYKKFAARLSRGCPETYFDVYGSCIRRFARSRTGMEHYRRVREHLKRIRKIHPDGFDSLLAGIRSANRGRRVLIRLLADI